MSPARRRLGTLLLGLTFIALVAVVSVPRADSAVVSGPGGSGIDTSLPETDSAVTVNGRGDFASLSLRVNQTRNLTNQAVSLTWTGGVPTERPGRFEQNYLQVMQCWGDDDGTNPENPGPPPEQCVSGATTGAYGVGGLVHPAGSEAISRIVSFGSWPNAATTSGWRDPANGFIWRSFRAVDGTVVNAQYDTNFNPELGGGNYWQNPYFDITTTNELAGAVTRPNGTGSDLIEINTGVESSGLGCGQRLQRADGTFFTPKCWLVVVPRGSAETENVGTPFEVDAAKFGVMTSPLSDNAWKNRIAVPARVQLGRPGLHHRHPGAPTGRDRVGRRRGVQLAAGPLLHRRTPALQLRLARGRHRPSADPEPDRGCAGHGRGLRGGCAGTGRSQEPAGVRAACVVRSGDRLQRRPHPHPRRRSKRLRTSPA